MFVCIAAARSRARQGDIGKGIEPYLAALSIDPNNRAAHFRVGMMYGLWDNDTRAIMHFEEIRRLGPETEEELAADPVPYYRCAVDTLVSCYERTGNSQKAAEILAEQTAFQQRRTYD